MIGKYQDSNIRRIWSDDNKFELMETIELNWLQAISNNFNLEMDTSISRSLNVNQIREIEKDTKHEVAAFIQEMELRLVDKTAKQYLHYNLTSSDLLDSVATLQHRVSFNLFEDLYYHLGAALNVIVSDEVYSTIKQIGRTHGRYAEEINLINRFENLYEGISSSFTNLKTAIRQLPGKLSGPVGATKMPKKVLEYTARHSGFPLSSYKMQIVPRQLYAEITFHICNLATWYEKFCTDLRLLSFDEISEMQEGFDRYQWGSSAMPHKKNPIISERICGLSRLLRQSLSTALENNVTWLERDISHSSTERVNWENQWHLICYMTKLMTNLLNDLKINLGNIERNLRNAIMSVDTLNANIVMYSGRTEAYEKTRESFNGPQGDLQAKNVDLYGMSTLQKKV